MFVGSEAKRLLNGEPDYVVDCIDDVNTKAELIAYCINHNIRVITSMGAGGKADPTKLRIGPLSDCINDPLASKIKWKLKKHNISPDVVTTLFSIERPICDLIPLDDDQIDVPQDFGAVDYMRIRVVPVLGTSPSIFGQALGSYILCQIAGKAYEPESFERLSKNLRHKMRQSMKNNEVRLILMPL
jgi:tRNA A37 threonylcarbamoyladenosine dehydratase